MPRELITIQVGQCGNQIGHGFWELALKEHSKNCKNNLFDDSLSSFFRNVDSRSGSVGELPFNDGKNKICNLKARALIVDMEENVISQLFRSEIGELFDDRQLIKDVSGAGNNWFEGNFIFIQNSRAHGFNYYGPMYEENILDRLQKNVETCDSLQCFLMLHSTGGGTGSGFGSFLVGLLAENYPSVFRFTGSVFPSKDDDVNVSPYNSMLSLNQLIQHADCVMPIDNQALLNICKTIDQPIKGKGNTEKATSDESLSLIKGAGDEKKKERPYGKMNNIVAHLLSNLTCSMRFEGILNVDLNEITMNLVPFPRLHFLVSSLAPLYSLADVKLQPRTLDQMFKDCYQSDYQLICSSPLAHRYLAMGLIIRGPVAFSDVNRNIKKIKDEINVIHWNKEGFKYGICNVSPIGQPYSLLCLANNTCIKDTFSELQGRFHKLYSKKVFVHHYTQYIEQDIFDEANTNVTDLIKLYDEFEEASPPEKIPKLKPLI